MISLGREIWTQARSLISSENPHHYTEIRKKIELAKLVAQAASFAFGALAFTALVSGSPFKAVLEAGICYLAQETVDVLSHAAEQHAQHGDSVISDLTPPTLERWLNRAPTLEKIYLIFLKN